MTDLLEVKNLSVSFTTSKGVVDAVRDVSFNLKPGESLGVVGESGSGKSVTSLALFDLLASNAIIKSGEIYYRGKNIFTFSEKEKTKLRGSEISMIFQDPMTSLNPCFTVEQQIAETLRVHLGLEPKAAKDRVLELLNQVGIPSPESRLKSFPHELSGGMSQRVMIAMAIACQPKILIADEPTTALDVTIQKQILDLLKDLQRKQNMSLILVSHDLGVIARNTDRMLVMYAGEIVEEGNSSELIASPAHPYTEGLLKCLPGLYKNPDENFRLPTIPGIVPNLAERPKGCQLAPRCNRAQDNCRIQAVELKLVNNNQRKVRCFYPISEESL